jgi:uncharacterized protein (TIGR02453 family)
MRASKTIAEPQLQPFNGFSANGMAFLGDLDATQNRAWFEANKAVYETELRAPLASLVTALGLALSVEGLDLACDPKRAMFRIHRDVRFSKDKRPYKAHVSAALTRDGEKMAPGLLYVHVDPKGSFVAAGFYNPEPAALQKLRQHIVARPDEIKSILAKLGKAGLSLDREDMLKRTPRGFEAVDDDELIALLRQKMFVVRRPLSRKTTGDGDAMISAIATFARDVQPLLRFGWQALATKR